MFVWQIKSTFRFLHEKSTQRQPNRDRKLLYLDIEAMTLQTEKHAQFFSRIFNRKVRKYLTVCVF